MWVCKRRFVAGLFTGYYMRLYMLLTTCPLDGSVDGTRATVWCCFAQAASKESAVMRLRLQLRRSGNNRQSIGMNVVRRVPCRCWILDMRHASAVRKDRLTALSLRVLYVVHSSSAMLHLPTLQQHPHSDHVRGSSCNALTMFFRLALHVDALVMCFTAILSLSENSTSIRVSTVMLSPCRSTLRNSAFCS